MVLLKLLIIGAVVFAAIYIWVLIVDPAAAVGFNPLQFIGSMVEAVLTLVFDLIIYIIYIPVQIIASIFSVTLTPPSITPPVLTF